MPLNYSDFFNVGKVTAVLINADPSNQKRITNTVGGKLHYKTTSAVSTSDSGLEPGEGLTIVQTTWIISASESKVLIDNFAGAASTIASASGPTGVWAGTYAPVAATTGTDVAFAEKKLFLSSVYLPANKTITGIGVLLGGEGGTNKLVAGLFNSSGAVVARSSETTEGTTAGTKETVQELAFTSAYTASGPATYFIGITGNGTTAKFRTIPSNTAGKNVFAGEVELAAKNVLASVTVPSTFTGGKGPVAFVY